MVKTSLTEEKIRELYSTYRSGSTLAETGAPIGMSPQTIARLFKKRGLPVRRRGEIPRRAVAKTDDSLLVEFKRKWGSLESTAKGTIAEGYVKNRLAELGFDVWEPVTQNHQTDLIILLASRVVRVQVKAATYDTKRKRFRANLSRRRRGGGASRYDPGAVDFFIVYCAGLQQMEFYVIPASLQLKSPTAALLPHRQRFANFSTFTWESYRNAFHLIKAAECSGASA